MHLTPCLVLSVLGLASLTQRSCAQDARKPIPYKVQKPPLDTPWTYKVGTDPWPEHPRPQLVRDAWQSLNGIWTYQPAEEKKGVKFLPGRPLEREVLIPSCIESGLSGLQELNVTRMWFATTFEVPAHWERQMVLLHFEAVDYEAKVFVNGERVGSHVGGYSRFSLDVTRHLRPEGANDLLVYVHDPTDVKPHVIPVGKQSKNPRHIWYRPCSGIWQQVWVESVPVNHITQLDIEANMDGKLVVFAHNSQAQISPHVEVSVYDADGKLVVKGSGQSNSPFGVQVKSPHLWSPSHPVLYRLSLTMGSDQVSSYTGFRSISTGVVNGIPRPLLNGEFIFQFGTLDQGYWPDGLYTPPSRDALIYDLRVLKSLGLICCASISKLNLICTGHPNAAQQEEYQRQIETIVQQHKNSPSIFTWVIYNEGWGQLRSPPWPEEKLVDIIRGLDPTRLINAVSGWFDHGFGDFADNHHYTGPQCGVPPYDTRRVSLQGEFGGIGHNVSIEHLWNVKQAIDGIDETYEIVKDLKAYNQRSGDLLHELRQQIEQHACSGGVWTQTTDVEGEVNGLLTYDRRILRPNIGQWRKDITALYEAARVRLGKM
ncbi:putative beta-glucuronidase like protein [Verticillium longisporum]|nr:putative beta-glucuronidase like protein [Verticillium longisporum]